MSRAEPVTTELSPHALPDLRDPQPPKTGLVVPVMRALDVLGAFTAHDHWLGNKEIADRTGMPASTVSRFLRSLVSLGFLTYSAGLRQYRLAASVLSLGYAATSHSDVQRQIREDLVRFACDHNVTVLLAMRDRLDLVALESCTGNGSFRRNGLNVGTRISVASSQMGITLLASLPPLERAYLLENIARRMPEGWREPEPNLSEAIRQLRNMGFCYSLSKWERDLGIISVPLSLPGRGLFVLTCLGSLGQMTKARIARELGPQLLGLARQLKASLDVSGDSQEG